MKLEYDFQLKSLERKHGEEEANLKMCQNLRLESVRAAAKLEVEKAEKRIRTLELNLNGVSDAERVWNLYSRHQGQRSSVRERGVKYVVSEKRGMVAPCKLSGLELPLLAVRPRSSMRKAKCCPRAQATVRRIPEDC
jgi:hypothetical protein